jgi:Protein of unknown function, DUF536.
MDLKTVSELSELFGVTRQAMNNRVKKLDANFVEKNEKGTTVVNISGIKELEKIYDKKVILEVEGTPEDSKMQGADLSTILTSLMDDKNLEIRRLTEQLKVKDAQLANKDLQLASKDNQISIKDQQISEKDKQLDQQQQLTAKAMADTEKFLLDFNEEQRKGFFARLFGSKKNDSDLS